jgi:hypothetical protein
MWLFTTFGFFSVVQKSHSDGLTVRARDAADLDRLRAEYLPELSATVTPLHIARAQPLQTEFCEKN